MLDTMEGGQVKITIPRAVIKDAHKWSCSECKQKFEKKDDALGHAAKHGEGKPVGKLILQIKHNFPKGALLFCPENRCIRSINGCAETVSAKNGRPFSSLFEVRRHWLRAHSPDRPYVCNTCSQNSKVFRFALKSDLKEHQMTCGKNCLIWLCGKADCTTKCSSKKALIRHCKRFGHNLPNPLQGVAASNLAFGKVSNERALKLKLDEKNTKNVSLKGYTKSKDPIKRRLAVCGERLMAFEGLQRDEDRINLENTSKRSRYDTDSTPRKRETADKSSKSNALNNEVSGHKVISGSKLVALEAALASY